MNTNEEIEYLFNKSGSSNKREPIKTTRNTLLTKSYNPNKYLNIDFETLDNNNFFELSVQNWNIGYFSTPDETLEILRTMIPKNEEEFDFMSDELIRVISSNIYDCFNTLNNYIKELKRIEVLTDNIVFINNRDFIESTERNQRIVDLQQSLDFVSTKRKKVENLTNKFFKLRDNVRFYFANKGSFDNEEKMMFLKKIQTFLTDNKHIIHENIYKELKEDRELIIDEVMKIKEQTYKMIAAGKTLDVNSKYGSYADRYINQKLNETPLSKFVAEKMLTDSAKAHLQFTPNQINKNIYLLDDSSILIQKKDGTYKTVVGINDYVDLMKNMTKDLMSLKIKNKPKLLSFFHNKLLEEGLNHINYQAAASTIESFINNETVLKNMNFNLLTFIDKGFEAIDDHINAVVTSYKVNQFSNKILSNKYKSFKSPESDIYFKELYTKELSDKDLQNFIGKKLATIKTPEDLTNLLKNVFNQIDGFNWEAVNYKLNKNNLVPILNEDDKVIFEINTYQQCRSFGSPSWCIHRTESYFDDYAGNGARQLIMYDFSRDSKDNYSIIGFTLYPDGKLRTQHLKNDDYIDFNRDKKLKDIYLKSVEAIIDEDKLAPELVELLKESKNVETIKQIKKAKVG